jgi:hypothetical protein
MKIIGARWNASNSTYCTDFDDGITVMFNEQYVVQNMLSTGVGSYYLKTGKWPKGKNLAKRTELATVWLDRNKKRYKKSRK